MGEEHFELLSELHRNHVFISFSQIPGNLAGIFVFFTGDRPGVSVGAAVRLGWANLAGQFQRTVLRATLARRALVRIGIIPAELLERVTLRADVLIILCIPVEICACPGAIGASSLADQVIVGIAEECRAFAGRSSGKRFTGSFSDPPYSIGLRGQNGK